MKRMLSGLVELNSVLDELAAMKAQMSRSSSEGTLRPLHHAGKEVLRPPSKTSLRTPSPASPSALSSKMTPTHNRSRGLSPEQLTLKSSKSSPKFTKSEYNFGDLRKEEPTATIRFNPGGLGLEVDGAQVTRSWLQAWNKGARPGWVILSVAGRKVTHENEDDVEEFLREADEGDARYEITFQRGRAKFGTGVVKLSRIVLEKEENCNRLRKTFKYQGDIERAEQRCITLSQLDTLRRYAEGYCGNWRDEAPPEVSPFSGKRLRMEIFNFYHANAWVISPATAKRKCAFVELLTSRKQVPEWCVIHWWGQPLADFIKCLKKHVVVRGLAAETPFWIAAFALRQHDLKGEMDTEQHQARCLKAFHNCQFHILLALDAQATAFKRTWCAFEIGLCLGRSNLSFDIAICQDSSAHLLTYGLVPEEEQKENQQVGAGVAMKNERERGFPLAVAAQGLEIQVENSEATDILEQGRVLNSIVGRGLDAGALDLSHKLYKEANGKLRSFFATHLLPVAAVQPEDEERPLLWNQISETLRNDVWRKQVDWKLDGFPRDGMMLLFQSFPPRLEHITLRFKGSNLQDEHVEQLALTLQDHAVIGAGGGGEAGSPSASAAKRSVKLDFRSCKEVDGDETQEVFKQLKDEGVEVDLDVAATEAVCSVDDITGKVMGNALQMNLVREGVKLKHYTKRVVPAVPTLMKTLATDDSARARRAAALALGTLGQAAFDAVPALQQAEHDDPEDSVKRAATSALAKITGSTQD